MTAVSAHPSCFTSALEVAVRRIPEISTLPQVALRVVQVASNPNAGARELKEVMEADAALSARVLRCVNSSAYALRTKVSNLQQAIAYLGLRQVRNLAMTASVNDLFRQDEHVGTYRRTELWRHLVAVGICARFIATRLRFQEFEDVFLAGLLHDIGIILADEHFHERFVRVIGSAEAGKEISTVEQAVFGFDHAMLGQRVAQMWHFPESLTAAIRYHHNSALYHGEALPIVRCVEVANLICSLKGITSIGVQSVAFHQAPFAGLGLTKDDVVVLVNDLDRELQSNQNLFQV